MRYGCCLNWVARGVDGTGAEAAPILAKAGYDYVELSMNHLMRLEPAERERVLAPVRDSGLPCDACNNFLPASIRLTGPDADHATALEYARTSLELARSLGIAIVVFGSGKARNPPEGYSLELARDQLVSFARTLDPIAADNGITIAMEHLNRGESDILTSFADMVRFVREVDRQRIRILLDTYHLELEKEPLEDVLQGEGILMHTHTARLAGRTWPQRSTPQLRGIFSALSELGYDGRMSVEASTEDLEADCAGTLALLRSLEKEYASRAAL
ncbi:MAG TPA: sugar phosphate isomerase/epimerase family protein [bacterium]|nr:sugar phosphate isomerase/epimerase family protein [bacterium]